MIEKLNRRLNNRWFVWGTGLVTIAFVGFVLNYLGRGHMDSSQDRRQLPGIPPDAPPPLYLSTIEQPSMVPESVDAVTAAVTLEWDANSEPDLAGYRLYQGPASGTYTVVTPHTSTMITVANLAPGSTRYFAVSAVNTSGMESALSAELVYPVPGGGGTPPPTPQPTATIAPTPVPVPTATPTPRPTVSPTASPGGSPGINVPSTVVFTWVTGTAFPTPFPITVTTSNGANWTSFDTCVWFDTCPQGGPCTNYGSSGGQCLLQPHTHSSYPTCNLTFSAPGLQSKIVKVTMKKITPTPSPRPIPPTPTPSPAPSATPIWTPTPSPTASPSPRPRPVSPTPCQPCPTCPPSG